MNNGPEWWWAWTKKSSSSNVWRFTVQIISFNASEQQSTAITIFIYPPVYAICTQSKCSKNVFVCPKCTLIVLDIRGASPSAHQPHVCHFTIPWSKSKRNSSAKPHISICHRYGSDDGSGNIHFIWSLDLLIGQFNIESPAHLNSAHVYSPKVIYSRTHAIVYRFSLFLSFLSSRVTFFSLFFSDKKKRVKIGKSVYNLILPIIIFFSMESFEGFNQC